MITKTFEEKAEQNGIWKGRCKSCKKVCYEMLDEYAQPDKFDREQRICSLCGDGKLHWRLE